MATESFSRTVWFSTVWGANNLEKAIDAGSPPIVQRLRSPEYQARFRKMTEITPEKIAKLKHAYGAE